MQNYLKNKPQTKNKKKKKEISLWRDLLRIFSANVLLILSPLSFRFVSKLEKNRKRKKKKEMSSGKKMAIKILSLFWVSVVDFYVKTNLCLQMEKLFLLFFVEFCFVGAKTDKHKSMNNLNNKNKFKEKMSKLLLTGFWDGFFAWWIGF